MTLSISSTVATYPRLPYERIARDLLGASYRLSLVFIGTKRAETLNRTYRQKTYVPNVLSFPLDTTSGEIYICPRAAAREAAAFGLSLRGYIGYLFIHGILHLKGYPHGATMEQAENKYISKYHLK